MARAAPQLEHHVGADEPRLKSARKLVGWLNSNVDDIEEELKEEYPTQTGARPPLSSSSSAAARYRSGEAVAEGTHRSATANPDADCDPGGKSLWSVLLKSISAFAQRSARPIPPPRWHADPSAGPMQKLSKSKTAVSCREYRLATAPYLRFFKAYFRNIVE